MSWGDSPVFVVPLVFVIGSWDVDDAVRAAVGGALGKGLGAIGAQTKFSNG